MRIVIAPGASGSAASMQRHVEGLAARRVDAAAIDLPLRRAEEAVTAFRRAVAALPKSPGLPEAPGLPRVPDVPGRFVIGGQSYGGRVASLLAAQDASAWAGLVLFSYPLHRPGLPGWEERTVHWPRLALPVLMLSGEADPFASIDLLRRAIEERLPAAELVTWPRLGHSLTPVLDEVLDRVAAFVKALVPIP